MKTGTFHGKLGRIRALRNNDVSSADGYTVHPVGYRGTDVLDKEKTPHS